MINLEQKIEQTKEVLAVWKQAKSNPSWNEIADITVEALTYYLDSMNALIEMGAEHDREMAKLGKCTKCGEPVLGSENGLCGACI